MDENAITEILARRTNAQRQEIKAAFQQDFGKVRESENRTHFITRAIDLACLYAGVLFFSS